MIRVRVEHVDGDGNATPIAEMKLVKGRTVHDATGEIGMFAVDAREREAPALGIPASTSADTVIGHNRRRTVWELISMAAQWAGADALAAQRRAKAAA